MRSAWPERNKQPGSGSGKRWVEDAAATCAWWGGEDRERPYKALGHCTEFDFYPQ